MMNVRVQHGRVVVHAGGTGLKRAWSSWRGLKETPVMRTGPFTIAPFPLHADLSHTSDAARTSEEVSSLLNGGACMGIAATRWGAP